MGGSVLKAVTEPVCVGRAWYVVVHAVSGRYTLIRATLRLELKTHTQQAAV